MIIAWIFSGLALAALPIGLRILWERVKNVDLHYEEDEAVARLHEEWPYSQDES